METDPTVRAEWDNEIAQAAILADDLAVMDSLTFMEPTPDAMGIILATVEPYSGALYTGSVTIPELVARGATRYAVSLAVKQGWLRPYGHVNEGTRVKGVYLTPEGVAERDRRRAASVVGRIESARETMQGLSPTSPIRAVQERLIDGLKDELAACSVEDVIGQGGAVAMGTITVKPWVYAHLTPVESTEDQSASEPTRVTRMTATVVVERKARYTRRKPSCARRGWKA
jgi:hypothetical protein